MKQAILLIIGLTILTILVLAFASEAPTLFPTGGPRENITSAPQTPTTPQATIRPSTPVTAPTPVPRPVPTSTPKSPVVTQPIIPQYRIPEGYTREQLSPYFEKLRVSSIARNTFNDRAQSFRLYASLYGDETINITGWKIQTNRRSIIIPQGIAIYSPFALASEGDINLTRNSYVNVYLEKGPIDRNFRLNKCTGYLENLYDFDPSLPQQCPSISRSSYSHLSGECQKYIRSLSRCELPETGFYNSLPGTTDGNECRAFLQTIGHGTCFREYSGDDNFLSNEWRVWIDAGTGDVFDILHDKVLLFDKEGLLVNEYTY